MTASYFDVDGTLVSSNLMHTAVWYMANDINPLRSAKKLGRLLMRAPKLLVAEMRDRRSFNELLFECFRGTSEDRIQVLADEAYGWCMKDNIYDGAKDIVARAKDLGHEVVLVSGALDFLLERLAEDLGADHYVGNRLEIHEGYATGKLLRPVVAGPTKSRLIAEHARDHGHELEDCFGYSDSYSDVPMLSVVGHPAVINPDAQLLRLARTYQWPIIELAHD
ncbi:HAD-superfamily subfamily IB, PSPase-like protein [Plesiocystis pacifica SIR-1]|uniref:HAD-superfamily subfamily IB, PSPase-like protein n=1 Tax=Plesiocystis pacifica SIR-1 TaxID=391625 RepID=A6FY49_9BACT|nr:HAD-IB family hydrolase [Plesiocystis pacifica]EDM81428.1 HAD-superfamily subfamily IB, PSPase-like protein [Plesiocystis pacifica SIR-1]